MSADWWDEKSTMSEKLDSLCKSLEAASTLNYSLNFPMLEPDKFGWSKGKKYARVWYDCSNGQRFVAFFVQLDNGDVWKADGWKTPTLNFVRGNVATAEGRRTLVMGKVNPNGHFYAGL